ncbi:hypothetical protein INR49_008802, partial [Caranx melampygus]
MSRFSRFTWIMSLLCVDTAISQAVMVKGYVGDGVLMSCVSSAGDFRPDQVNVYWRDKNDNVVLDIVKGVHDPRTQHQRFRGRVLSPQDQNRKGNFSVVLQNLREDDAGEYECNIPSEDVQKKFSLTVTSNPVPASRATPPPSPPSSLLLQLRGNKRISVDGEEREGRDDGVTSPPNTRNRVNMDATRSCAGWSLWLLLVLAAHAVSSQVEVKGVVGDDVLLPCSYPGLQLPPEGLNVSWRNQGEQMVLGIDGAQNLTHQDQKFRGRVTSFPHLYRHGNFSVVNLSLLNHLAVDIWGRPPSTCPCSLSSSSSSSSVKPTSSTDDALMMGSTHDQESPADGRRPSSLRGLAGCFTL